MMPFTPMSTLPLNDGRTVTDDRIQEETPKPPVYVSTADGDVQTLVVEPSFDGSEKQDVKKTHHREASWQGVRATEEAKSAPPERTSLSPEKDGKPASHARNLSAHFFDAATIKDSAAEPPAPGVSFDDQSHRSGYPVQHSGTAPTTGGVSPISPAVGKKHSRTFSGDMSNPALAHRRIDSIGSSAPIERGPGNPFLGNYTRGQTPQGPPRHHRSDSAGLDMLSAAIHATDVPREDLLSTAVGAPTHAAHQPDAPEPPAEAPREDRRSPPDATMMRTSPNEMGGGQYDYPPPSGSMGAPQFRPPQEAAPVSYQNVYQPGSYPPQQAYYQPQGQSFYHPNAPQVGYHQRQMSRSQPSGYPMQFAPPRGNYGKASFAPPPTNASADPAMHRREESGSKIDTDEPLFSNRNMPGVPRHWGGPPRPGTSTGVQTFVTTMSVGDGNKTMRAAATLKTAGTNTDPSNDQVPSTVGHHRKMSSFSSLSTMLGPGSFPEDQQSAQTHQKPGSSYFHNPIDQRSRPAGAPLSAPPPQQSGHHRKTSSSLSFLNALDEKTVTGRGHHRSTSSSVSFLHGLDNFDPNDAFTSPLDGQPNPFSGPNTSKSSPYGQAGPYAGAQYRGPRPHDTQSSNVCIPVMQGAPPPHMVAPAPVAPAADIAAAAAATSKSSSSSGRLASGGTSKRVRRKCTVQGCPNRVVQGGLCISHGAKRKQCKHPGCTKNVKKAGLCSTHGPARKRCEFEGCQKVAVQGGRCIAHGAKKKLCKMDGCNKQAILSGMCKKHHDQSTGRSSGRRGSDSSGRDPSPPIAPAAAPKPATTSRQPKRKSHTRGLSIFQEVSPENIQTILEESGSQDQPAPEAEDPTFGYSDRMM